MLITILSLIKILIIVIFLLVSVAYFTLAERKIMGSIQRYRGPNVIGGFWLKIQSKVLNKDDTIWTTY